MGRLHPVGSTRGCGARIPRAARSPTLSARRSIGRAARCVGVAGASRRFPRERGRPPPLVSTPACRVLRLSPGAAGGGSWTNHRTPRRTRWFSPRAPPGCEPAGPARAGARPPGGPEPGPRPPRPRPICGRSRPRSRRRGRRWPGSRDAAQSVPAVPGAPPPVDGRVTRPALEHGHPIPPRRADRSDRVSRDVTVRVLRSTRHGGPRAQRARRHPAGGDQGGLRPRRVPLPRQGQGPRRCCPRSGTGVLAMGMRMDRRDDRASDLQEKIVSLNRVAKVVKGGRRFSFSALVVVGDGAGRVGAGLGKAGEVPDAIRKGVDDAKKNMITVPMVGTTIPHEVHYKLGAAKVLLKPAVPGTGVISGSSMRAVVEAAGIHDILTKSLGTDNPINVVRATIAALASMRTLREVATLRGRTPEQLVGRRRAAEMLGEGASTPEVVSA